MKKILAFTLASTLLVLQLSFLFPAITLFKNKKAKAEYSVFLPILESTINEDFISANMATLNGATLSHSVPIDSTTGLKPEGNSLILGSSTGIGSSFAVDFSSSGSNVNDNLSVFVWIFVPVTNPGTITVRLGGVSGENTYLISWEVSGDNQKSLAEKTTADTLTCLGWNLLELPFSMSEITINGVAQETFQISLVDSFEIFQASSLYTMKIFDAFVADSSSTSYKIVEDQSYVAAPVKTQLSNQWAGSASGDKIVLPLFENVLKFAWVGDNDCSALSGTLAAGTLYEGGTLAVDTAYIWKIQIYEPGSSNFTYFNFGDQTNKTFARGTYTIKIVMFLDDPVFTHYSYGPILSVVIPVQSSGVWFDKSRTVVDTDYEYKIYFSLDSSYWNIAEENFELTVSNSKILEIVEVNFEEGYCIVKGKKEGKATLSIETTGTRTKAGTGQGSVEFSDTLSITVSKIEKDNNDWVVITIWIILGLTLAGSATFGILSIIKSNKMPIK